MPAFSLAHGQDIDTGSDLAEGFGKLRVCSHIVIFDYMLNPDGAMASLRLAKSLEFPDWDDPEPESITEFLQSLVVFSRLTCRNGGSAGSPNARNRN